MIGHGGSIRVPEARRRQPGRCPPGDRGVGSGNDAIRGKPAMDMNDLILVSVDDHVVEPPDMWERHVSKADLERAPRVIHKDELDADVWTFEGTEIPNVGLNAVAGRPPRGVRLRADRVRRDPPGRVRHPRAHPRHERQRRARVDVLPVDDRLLRPALQPHARPRARPASAAGLQQLAHRRVVRHVPRPVHAAGHRAASGTPS